MNKWVFLAILLLIFLFLYLIPNASSGIGGHSFESGGL